jgi:hypothetical protein
VSEQFEDMKRLTEMLERGKITQEEFDKLKASLLAEAPNPARAPEPSPSPGASTAPRQVGAQTRWFLIGAGILMAIGSFLPWARAGIFSVAGTEGDGILTLIAGVIIAIVGVANRATLITGIGTVVVAGFSVWVVVNVFNNLSSDVSSIGTGLVLTGIASLFALIAGVDLIRHSRS